MKELDKLLTSMSIDELLSFDFDKYSSEEREYLHNRVTEIADEKCYSTGINYNIRDTELVDKLDSKLKLIELALTLAYNSKCNFDDVFQQTRMWDSLIYNQLKKKNIVLPPMSVHKKDSAYVGAYVKEPQIGLHKWVASLDLNSLYPSLIQQFNISPEMLIEPEAYSDSMRRAIASEVTIDKLLSCEIDTSFLQESSTTITPNGQFFRTNKQGFLSEIMERMYNDRSVYKKKSLEAKKELEKVLAEIQRRKNNK